MKKYTTSAKDNLKSFAITAGFLLLTGIVYTINFVAFSWLTQDNPYFNKQLATPPANTQETNQTAVNEGAKEREWSL